MTLVASLKLDSLRVYHDPCEGSARKEQNSSAVRLAAGTYLPVSSIGWSAVGWIPGGSSGVFDGSGSVYIAIPRGESVIYPTAQLDRTNFNALPKVAPHETRIRMGVFTLTEPADVYVHEEVTASGCGEGVLSGGDVTILKIG